MCYDTSMKRFTIVDNTDKKQEINAYPNAEEEFAKQDKMQHIQSDAAYQGLIEHPDEVLAEARSVFPFDLFPDLIQLKRSQVIWHHNLFFFSEKIETFTVNKITNLTMTRSFLFSTVVLEIMGHAVAPKIQYLWNKDAERLRDTFYSLKIAAQSGIDVYDLSVEKIQALRKQTSGTHS